jgi:hypothetical protein
MTDKLIHTESILADGGTVRINMLQCPSTGDVIVRFGKSYTLRMPPMEAAALFKTLSKTANDVAGPELATE